MAEKIELTGVPETMLQTLYARAKESAGRGAVSDKKAEFVPIYKLLGRIPFIRNISNKIVVLEKR